MKILLTAINAKYIHSNPAVRILKRYAAKYDDNIEIAEYTINNQAEDILSDIYRRKPDVIAFSCYIWNFNMVDWLLNEIPKVLPNAKLWLGGPEVTYDADKRLLKYPMLTGVMVGEGEDTFFDVVTHYVEGNIELSDIRGLYLQGETPFFTGERPPINMDSIPFYYEDMTDLENRIVYYETSRGCPFACSYCLSSIGEKVRLRSLDLVYKELQFFIDKKVPQVKFIDRTFNCNHEHALGIWNYIMEHDNGITNFHFEISADLIREDELELMSKMRPGLIQLEIGVQSTNEATIREIRRTMKLDRLGEVVAKIHSFGNIHQHLDLIAGLPQEDYSSFVKSFNDVYAMKPDQLQLGFLKVLKGSYMETKAKDYGILYQSSSPYEVLSTNWLTYDEVLELKKVEEMVEQYYNSYQFAYTIPVLLKAFDSPFDMYKKLADYYDEQGYYTNKPARSYKYEVLLNFARTYDSGNEELYKELLTFDMYLREKCKSRPSFSRDLIPLKEEIYRREQNRRNHIDVFYYEVWERGSANRLKNPAYVEFDYDNRDPLSNNAKVTVWRE